MEYIPRRKKTEVLLIAPKTARLPLPMMFWGLCLRALRADRPDEVSLRCDGDEPVKNLPVWYFHADAAPDWDLKAAAILSGDRRGLAS